MKKKIMACCEWKKKRREKKKTHNFTENHTNAANLTYHTIKVNEDNNDAAIETTRANCTNKCQHRAQTDKQQRFRHIATKHTFYPFFHMNITVQTVVCLWYKVFKYIMSFSLEIHVCNGTFSLFYDNSK